VRTMALARWLPSWLRVAVILVSNMLFCCCQGCNMAEFHMKPDTAGLELKAKRESGPAIADVANSTG
jgi:hypothetical protein